MCCVFSASFQNKQPDREDKMLDEVFFKQNKTKQNKNTDMPRFVHVSGYRPQHIDTVFTNCVISCSRYMFIGQKAGNRSSRRRSIYVGVTPRNIFEVCQFPALFVVTNPDTFWVEVRLFVGKKTDILTRSWTIFIHVCGEKIFYILFYFYTFILRGSQDVFGRVCGEEHFFFFLSLTGCRDISCCFCGYKNLIFLKLGHVQPCLWWERIDVFDRKSRHLEPCL